METGKLPSKLLNKLLEDNILDENVIIGPQIGMDAAVIKTNNTPLVIGADPITFNTDIIGEYCVFVNANDIAVMGGIPKYFIATILLPPKTSEHKAINIFKQVKSACNKLNICLIGGHTEITDSVLRPIISGCMIGEQTHHLNPKNTKDDDDIILVNKPAIEGTAILAFNAKEKLLNAKISKEKVNFALNLLDTHGICVLDPARIALNSGDIYYMHDPTEGGIASALQELSFACGKTIIIDSIPFMEECTEFCKVLNLNEMGLISSGSLILIANKDNTKNIIDNLNSNGYFAEVIGKAYGDTPKVKYKDGKKFPTFSRDEIARFFEESL